MCESLYFIMHSKHISYPSFFDYAPQTNPCGACLTKMCIIKTQMNKTKKIPFLLKCHSIYCNLYVKIICTIVIFVVVFNFGHLPQIKKKTKKNIKTEIKTKQKRKQFSHIMTTIHCNF